MALPGDRSEIAFFDLETTRTSQCFVILEFGAILVCPKKLEELQSYSTLVQPTDLSLISDLADRSNGITLNAIVSAPYFAEIANTVFDILHGRIWAGHNIVRFDCVRIREAFEEVGREAPKPKGTIDSWALLTNKFGRRAGDMKMATLATYFGLGQQTHRSLDDVRMNLEVLKRCTSVLFLESSFPDLFHDPFIEPDEVSTNNITADFVGDVITIFHRDDILQLYCARLEVRFGIRMKFFDNAGRPRLNFVVDISPSLCEVLDVCDSAAQKLIMDSRSSSDWRPVVTRKIGFNPTARLHIRTTVSGDGPQYGTEICQKEPSGTVQKLVFMKFDAEELDMLFKPGTFVDAFLSLEPYDYQQNAGIRLVVERLIIPSE